MEIEQNLGWVMILKVEDESNINQFWLISEWWIEKVLKLKGLQHSTYLKPNSFIDPSVQKAVIPGFSRFLEDTSITWHQIRSVWKQKQELHVVFLDLANAF